jgi:hypothetical protein
VDCFKAVIRNFLGASKRNPKQFPINRSPGEIPTGYFTDPTEMNYHRFTLEYTCL